MTQLPSGDKHTESPR